MYIAQCPHCNTIFRTDFSVLGPHGGKVVCGVCHRGFNAFEHPYLPTEDALAALSQQPSTPSVDLETSIEPPVPGGESAEPETVAVASDLSFLLLDPVNAPEAAQQPSTREDEPAVDEALSVPSETVALTDDAPSAQESDPVIDASPTDNPETAPLPVVDPTATDLDPLTSPVEPSDVAAGPVSEPEQTPTEDSSSEAAPLLDPDSDAEIDELLKMIRAAGDEKRADEAGDSTAAPDAIAPADDVVTDPEMLVDATAQPETSDAETVALVRADEPASPDTNPADTGPVDVDSSKTARLLVLIALLTLLLIGQIGFFFRNEIYALLDL